MIDKRKKKITKYNKVGENNKDTKEKNANKRDFYFLVHRRQQKKFQQTFKKNSGLEN